MPEIATWSEAEFSFQIDYSRATLENIRQSAMQGLMDLPKIGLGVGGVLLGDRENGRITILDSFEIPCSHAFGPSFSLTPEELALARDLIAGKEASRVLGWYCSKGVRPLELNDSDRTLLGALFPDPWQIGLLLQPHMVRPARIAFFSLDSSGGLLNGGQGELAEWHEEPSESSPLAPTILPAVESTRVEPERVEPARLEPVKVEPAGMPPVNLEWVARSEHSGDTIAPDPVVTIRARNGSRWVRRDDPFSALVVDAAKRKGARWKQVAWGGAAVLVVAAAAGFVLTRDWTPGPAPPPLVLQSSDVNGTLVIRWNAEAVRGIDHADMFIDDGGRARAIPLNRAQLRAGELRYVRRSSSVTATMTAGKAQAKTSFNAPAPRRKKSQRVPANPESTTKAQ